jgi:putative ABC transport system permease protein
MEQHHEITVQHPASALQPQTPFVAQLSGTDNFLSFYRITLLAKRYPGTAGANDHVSSRSLDTGAAPSGGVVLNAAAARMFGWTSEEAIGKVLSMPSGPDAALTSTVIGVVGDTVSGTRTPALPLMFRRAILIMASSPRASVRLDEAVGDAIQERLAAEWQQLFPDEAIEPRFLEQAISAQYASDHTQMSTFAWSASLTVLIACFGRFGLAGFNTERRTKEIGVRKVMGGSVWSIMLLLTSDFSKLVLMANVLAWPLAYIAMQHWLENFAYPIDLTPLIFIGSGLIALCVAWVTVGGTAAKQRVKSRCWR